MKTKIALLVTVVTSILFLGGCASTPQTYHIENVVEKNGVYHHKDMNKPVTGRIVWIEHGQLHTETHVKDGLKHGSLRDFWGHKLDRPRIEAVYEKGVLIRFKWFNDDNTPESGEAFWEGTEQVIKKGWNKDGTPAEQGKEN